MINRHLAIAAFCCFLTACGGGGGGGTSAPATGGITPPAPPHISGDMMAMTANRGWNYQGTLNGQAVTVSLYTDPMVLTGGNQALVATAVTGTVPTVLTSHAFALANEIAGLSLVKGADGYHVTAEVSTGGAALVPGSPLFVPGDITQGQTWTPSPGASVSATLVGAVPGMSACAGATQGAELRYTYTGGYDNTIAYVPGCGITYVANNNNGQTLTLISTGSYSVGDLSAARRTASVTWLTTARTALGLNHIAMPAARNVRGLFLK